MQLLLQLVPGYPQPQRAAVVAAKQNTEVILALPKPLCHGLGHRVAYCYLPPFCFLRIPPNWGKPQLAS